MTQVACKNRHQQRVPAVHTKDCVFDAGSGSEWILERSGGGGGIGTNIGVSSDGVCHTDFSPGVSEQEQRFSLDVVGTRTSTFVPCRETFVTVA